MSRRRFMIQARYIRDGYASFDGEIFNHMVRVLRLGPGDAVQLIDEAGQKYVGIIDQVAKEWVAVKIETISQPNFTQPLLPRITICQALPKGEKIDLILQKGTELGTSCFNLFAGRRSVAKVRDGHEESKIERWQKIVSEASRQCGRHDVPEVHWYKSAEKVAETASHELRLILWEGEQECSLKSVLSTCGAPASVSVAIGPEGGFDPVELLHLSQSAFKPVSLGNRILRTETASIAILSILQYTWGNM